MNVIKPKPCKCCKTLFTPARPLARVCSLLCALTLVRQENDKKVNLLESANRKETRAKLEKLKSRSQLAKEAQISFNMWIRARDYNLPCISCGRYHQGQMHAGHYLSVGARPELRFEPFNTNKQCQPCNLHLSGNVILYRKALIKKIGLENVEWLEGPHPLQHYTIEDLKHIKTSYLAKAKILQKQQND